ncbi:MAG TPA: hypothetical protein DGG94_05390, partial [Micromonosporaceae bacterium]|nr:hypothetical protein [Micromonosporaceae bacterium]
MRDLLTDSRGSTLSNPKDVVAAGAAVGDGLARVLRTRLRASYVAKAARRNADYLAAADFPVRERDAPPDPASLAGLVGAIDPVEPGLCLDDGHLLRVIGRCGSLNRAEIRRASGRE